MTITVPTTKPAALKKKIFDAAEDETLKTWVIRNADEAYLTHKPAQWYDKVLLEFAENQNALIIRTYWWKGNVPDEDTKGYYIGRFCEALLVHFRGEFSNLTIDK